jgi:amino acid adenylation domain-containing protein
VRDNFPDKWEPQLLHHYFLKSVKMKGHELAIISSDFSWTYDQLQEYALQFKDELLKANINIGDRVIIELDPCPQAVALILACSMIGAVFVPVSPDSPIQRVVQILKQTEAKLYIQSSSVQKDLTFLDNCVLSAFLDRTTLTFFDFEVVIESNKQSNGVVLDTDLAYIIFTSGTTGMPKGIMMTHKAALSFFRALADYCSLLPGTRVGTIAPLQFDFALLDMGLAFGSGGTLVQVPRILVHHPKRFVHFLNKKEVIQMNGVPSIWSTLCNHAEVELTNLKSLQTIFYAGEYFPINHLRKIQKSIPSLKRIINCFGQSESIACSFIDVPNPIVEGIENVPIGYAHPGAEIILLNANLQQIHVENEIGEMYLRGSSLFSGYWKNEELTKEFLVPHPLRPDSSERVFKTGDRAYIGKDKHLYYVGRGDNQVQIMGNRVEPEEVERVVSSHPNVKDVAIVVLQQGEVLKLIAFVISNNRETLNEENVRLHCSHKLPHYMLPTQVKTVDCFPYTLNGKVDKNLLKENLKFKKTEDKTKC